ncbi:acyl-CoA N-acyltransferase [Aspergillus steynii IBT 23096]|uniref:Acyl-CoA N-acyltransferase n=1 Tax=Aspergillus steynii IBT 23096 TaxID=1392250 RepID=A0A2I2FU43_9EURO|nr:acyl-CoA N-acyltransferase [Aspergillus steynii IBT 23096]PLB44134.1 acyl-CoA N-acyltransferase [Aspergillus steynii IBT 23096]
MTSLQGLSIIEATPDHVPTIKAMVVAAYSKYIPRIGKPPAPMVADYYELLKTREIYALERLEDGRIVGSVVLRMDTDTASININNLVVDPGAQGKGYGRLLMDFAEGLGKERGCKAVVLFTNIKMYENLALYPKLGFVETDRREEDGYERVFYRKELN